MNTVREINKAISEYTLGNKGKPVYAEDSEGWQRISRARTQGGTLQVRCLHTGEWFTPKSVEQR